MAQKKIMNLASMQHYDEKIKAYLSAEDEETLAAAKAHAEGLADNYDAAGTAATKVQALADGAVAANTAAIAKLNGNASTEGSVAKAVADAKALVDADVDAVEAKANKNAEDIVAIQEDIGNTDDLETTAKNVVGAVNEALAAIGAGGTASAVTMSKKADPGEFACVYELKQGTTVIGTIDIPKELVVQNGEVVVDPIGQPAGTYIKLTLQNVEAPLYINVGTLVDIYKAAANAAQVQIAIDSATREVSAHIVAGSITATELAADAVITAKIADGNVTKAKLSAEVQASLDKADVALDQAKAYTDEKNSAMDERVKEVEAVLGSGEGSVVEQIAAAKQEAITTASGDATTKANQALTDAKKYADGEVAKVQASSDAVSGRVTTLEGKVADWDAAEGNANNYADTLNAAMNTRVAELEKVDHTHTNKTELDKIAVGDKAKWDGMQAAAEKTAADALAAAKTELDGKINTAKADVEAYADGKVANVQKEVDANETSIAGLDTRLTAAETDIDNLESRAAALESKVGDGFVEITTAEIDAMFA